MDSYFELRDPSSNSIVINDLFRNYSVIRHVDIVGGYPGVSDFPEMTETSIIFRRTLGLVGGKYQLRYVLCDLKAAPARDDQGLELFDASGRLVFSGAEEYVQVLGLRFPDVSRASPDYFGTMPPARSGGHVYVLHNNVGRIVDIHQYVSGGRGRVDYYGTLFWDDPDGSFQYSVRKVGTDFYPQHYNSVGIAGSGNNPLVFAEFSF